MFEAARFTEYFTHRILDDLDACMVPMCRHHFQNPGSQVRAQLAFDYSKAFDLSDETALSVAIIVELLHNASLIHDDIQDRALIRRHQNTLCERFGAENALSFGDYLISLAYETCALLPQASIGKAVRVVHQYVKNTITGQMLDINAAAHTEMTLKDYRKICWLKSGQLIMLCVHLPAMLANEEQHIDAFMKIIEPLIISFQILDDLTDMQEDRDEKNFSIFSILDNHEYIDALKAVRLANVDFHDAKGALNQLSTKFTQPFTGFFERIHQKLQKEFES
ncbi:geranyltranstransferase [Legionella geestiana]|uniref:Geranyltranstransferase n=1 Tax=Legionella geestiana TaxID=45065 RepID=A0A0W0TPG6_9GAMM|nr:polyprenyl synthetase family protein [Legionella geestiana]KTC97491.1 geranyltranstransferase [Legionella geestiana]QBS13304.1 hypothetical protein E4T54_11410 [Legionella geestiana]QDQ40897.1 hypothetical protein E3226_011035 [Legionella geestiana]STX54169.1 geranyltranstransferase [Legionella geestiana]